MSFGLPYQKRFSSPGAVRSVSGAGNTGVFPCSGAMSVLDCHHLHERFTESAPACSCTTPSAKFPPGHTVPQALLHSASLFTCHSSTEGIATAVSGDIWTSLCWWQYALRSLSTELHPAGTAVTLLGWTAHISVLEYKVLVSSKVWSTHQ